MARSSFRTYVTYRLELVSRVAREAADDTYRRECGFDIRQLRVLRTLAEQPDSTVSEIVDSTMFDRTLVSRIITDLVRAGCVQRQICGIDARQIRLSATPAGLAKVTQANALGDELNDDLLSVLTPAERDCFDRALGKLTTWQPPLRTEGPGRASAPQVPASASAPQVPASASAPQVPASASAPQVPARAGASSGPLDARAPEDTSR